MKGNVGIMKGVACRRLASLAVQHFCDGTCQEHSFGHLINMVGYCPMSKVYFQAWTGIKNLLQNYRRSTTCFQRSKWEHSLNWTLWTLIFCMLCTGAFVFKVTSPFGECIHRSQKCRIPLLEKFHTENHLSDYDSTEDQGDNYRNFHRGGRPDA